MRALYRAFARSIIPFLVLAFLPILPTLAQAADVSSTWLGGVGNWSDSSQWSSNPNFPHNGNAGFTYDAMIGSGTVTVDQNINIQRLDLNGGTIDGAAPHTLLITESLDW